MPTQDAISTKRALINSHLKKLIPTIEGPHASISESALYSLLSSGKRLRPLLILSVLEDYHVSIKKGINAACAIELIHIYSLIHDDLPCMDNDDLRRGRATLHKVFGEGQALLTGNFLLIRAFEMIAREPDLFTILASSTGENGLIGGQLIDLLYEGKKIDWETLRLMYIGKTAALFSAALQCGAVLAKASDRDRAALKIVGEHFGVAFQIYDDLSEGEMSSDVIQKKATCLTLFTRDVARDIACSFLKKALCALPQNMPSLQTIFFSHLKGLGYVEKDFFSR